MKNINLILNIVLVVAVAVLFYFQFSKPGSNTATSASGSALADVKVAYINSDTVLKYYDYFKVNSDKLEAKTQQLAQDYRNREMGLRNEFDAYQRSVNSMTLGQVRATEENLAKKQQNLQLYQQTLSQQLMEEQSKLNKELYDRITKFLKGYADEKGIQMVLKYDPTSDVLYGGQALDVTQDVIKGLNDQFKSEGNAPKSDTTATK